MEISNKPSCPICFEILTDMTKAKPDNCDHVFCLPCLKTWAKEGSYCPVERIRFKNVINLETGALIQIKSHKRKRKRREVYDFTLECEICSGGDSLLLVLCDCCDLAYHTHCLDPPLEDIPAGSWYCPTCISVEEKLKKKNGITKEVEAEVGMLLKNKHKKKLIKENEPIPKVKQLDNSTCVIKNDNLETCYVDVIPNLQDKIVKKQQYKNPSSSKYLDSTIHDNMVTKFDTNGEISCVTDSGVINYKTFASNTYIKRKKSYPKTNNTNAVSTCLNECSTRTSDNNFRNHALSPESQNISETARRKSLENMTARDTEAGLPSIRKLQNIRERAEKLLNVNSSYAEGINSSSSCVSNASFKGTSQHLIPFRTYERNSCVKNKPSKGTSKNLIVFSVFHEIEGIDASQVMYSQVSTIDVPFPTNIYLQNCSVYNNEFFGKSRLHCKLCKFKDLNSKESKRYSNYVIDFKKQLANTKYKNITRNKRKFDHQISGTEKNLISNSSKVIERRKRSLMRTLEKINDSKCINIISVN